MKAIILAVAFASVLFAQIPQMAIPDGNDMWVVQVVTSGGLLGAGSGDVAISSEGKIVCSREMRCPNSFPLSDFQPLVEIIQTGTLPVPLPPAVVSLCRDCIMRTIRISRRDSMGVVHYYTASWDDTTKDRLPREVIRIYDALLALRQ